MKVEKKEGFKEFDSSGRKPGESFQVVTAFCLYENEGIAIIVAMRK